MLRRSTLNRVGSIQRRNAGSTQAIRGNVDAPLEAVVEANTLLSGLGFESGGVAVAHGVAQTCTSLPGIPERYYHGEMVAIGTLVQLALEERRDETAKVARFFAQIGLPAHLGQLSVETSNAAAMDTLVEGTLAWPFTVNMPFDVDASMLRRALFEVQEIGESVASEVGDTAYRRFCSSTSGWRSVRSFLWRVCWFWRSAANGSCG